MNHQIDFLAIGKKRCGDAIAIRIGDLESGDPRKQFVIQIDGGYPEDSEQVVNHIRTHFNADRIDLLISSHPDNDHIGGMPDILQDISVSKLWMHKPAEHSAAMRLNRAVNYRVATLTAKIQASMQQSDDLQTTAEKLGIPIEEPFTGKTFATPYGVLTVLGPTKVYYEQLLVEILARSAKKAAQNRAAATSILHPQPGGDLVKALQKLLGAVENHHLETLTDDTTTTPTNNTSTILLLELYSGQKFLFTGDAGIPALEYAHGEFVARGHVAGSLDLVQVPHHASHKNVGPTILDNFLGVRTVLPGEQRGVAAASVGPTCEGDGHPYRVATNAFKRRGYPVWLTRGTGLLHGFDRLNWSATVQSLPLFESVELNG